MATISSTKSAFPPEAATMRSRSSAPSSWLPSRLAISVPHSSAPSGSSRSDVAFSLPPLQPGRASSSSVRAMQSRKIGASRERSATCSTRSTNSGCRPLQVVDDDDLRSLDRARLEQLAKRHPRLGGGRADDVLRLDPERHQHLDERPVRDLLAVREAAPAEHVRLGRRPRPGSRPRAVTCPSPQAREG